MASTIAARPLSPVLSTVSSALRRHYFSLVMEQLPWALTAFLSGLALLLVLGTRYLHPLWLLLFAAGGIAVLAVRIYGGWTDDYRMAQLLDSRLQLHDSLSTAWHILRQPSGAAPRTWAVQLASAEALAQSVDPRTAFPVHFRRLWFLPVLLSVLCCTMLALRWGHVSQLDLQRPLLPARIQSMLDRSGAEAAEEDRAASHREQKSADADVDLPNLPGTPPPTGKPASPAQNGQPTDPHSGASSLSDAKPDSPSPGAQNGSTSSPTSKQEPARGSSVLDRMKDALGSMASKLEHASKPKEAGSQKESNEGQKSPSDTQGQAAQQSAKDGTEKKAGGKSDKQGDPSKGDSNSEAQAVEKSQPGQQGEATAASNQHGNDAQSGAGHNDGRKEMQDAEQLKAMGKLAEIIGKRSASLTGEMTIEKPSGKQQLKTQYSNQNASHSDEGGELHRDQVPLEYRDFVRSYMEQVHQNPPASKSATSATH